MNTLAPEFELDAEGTLHVVRGPPDRGRRPPDAAPAPPRHRPLRRRATAAWSAAPRWRPTSTGELTEVAALVGQKQPDLLLLNEGDLAYAKIRLDERSLATVVGGLATLDDSLARALCWGAAWDMTRDAEMSATDFVAPGPLRDRQRDRRVRREPDPDVRRPGGSTFSAPGEPGRPEGDVGAGPAHAARERRGGQRPPAVVRPCLRRARRTATRRSRRSRALLDGSVTFEGLEVDTDLRWTLLTGLVRAGRADADRIDAELARDNTISGQEHAAAARAARPTAEAKAQAWEDAMVRDDIPNETQRSIVLAFQCHGQEEVLAPYVEKYLAAADTMWEEKGTQRASTALEYIFPRPLASQELLDRVDAWLESSPANPAAKRYVREGRADVARALAAQAKDARAERRPDASRPPPVSAGACCSVPGRVLARTASGGSGLGVQRLGRPRVLGEHLDAALEPAHEVALGEAGAHLEDAPAPPRRR